MQARKQASTKQQQEPSEISHASRSQASKKVNETCKVVKQEQEASKVTKDQADDEASKVASEQQEQEASANSYANRYPLTGSTT